MIWMYIILVPLLWIITREWKGHKRQHSLCGELSKSNQTGDPTQPGTLRAVHGTCSHRFQLLSECCLLSTGVCHHLPNSSQVHLSRKKENLHFISTSMCFIFGKISQRYRIVTSGHSNNQAIFYSHHCKDRSGQIVSIYKAHTLWKALGRQFCSTELWSSIWVKIQAPPMPRCMFSTNYIALDSVSSSVKKGKNNTSSLLLCGEDEMRWSISHVARILGAYGQDGGRGRSTKRRKTINLKTKNNHNCQKPNCMEVWQPKD